MIWIVVILIVLAQALDGVSTLYCMRDGFYEANPLLRNKDGKFVLWKGLLFKGGCVIPGVYWMLRHGGQMTPATLWALGALAIVPTLFVGLRNVWLLVKR